MDSQPTAYITPKLCELMMLVRDFVNEPKLRDSLFSEPRTWNMVCSAMDAVEDTDLAIEAYMGIVETEANEHKDHSGPGYAYLLCSGAMQSLFVQRDSVAKLCQCLIVDYDESRYPKLTEARVIRNQSTGHPVDWRGKHSVQIIQHSLSATGFEMFVFSDAHSYESILVSLPELVSDQRECLAEMLQEVIDQLGERARQHRKEFRAIKLAAMISPNMLYFFEKICEATRHPECAPTGSAALETIAGSLGKIEQALRDRGIERKTYDAIGYLYDILEYPIGKLRVYYRSVEEQREPGLDNETAYIMAFFVCEHIKKLKASLQEIDEEYASE